MEEISHKTVLFLCIAIQLLASNFNCQSRDGSSGTFTDTRDNNIYEWVKISNQVWMAENLRFKPDSGSWCWDNKEEECIVKGRLYAWATAMTIAPEGWHIPSDGEWKELEVALGLTARQADEEGLRIDSAGLLAGKIKSSDGWPLEYEGTPIIITNETGFSALETGLFANNEFSHAGYTGWWSSTDVDSKAWIRHIGFSDNSIGRVLNNKEFALPVRCIKDSE